MFDYSLFINCIYHFVAFHRHTLAKADDLVVLRHLFQKIRAVWSKTAISIQPILFLTRRLIQKHSHKINN